MKINTLFLTQFRNFESLNIEFDSNVTVIFGMNGQGKTNILEAIHYLSTSRSFRVKDDRNCIQFNQTMSRIVGTFTVKKLKKQLKVILSSDGKYLLENNKTYGTSKEFVGIVNTVLFTPSDLFLFEGFPKQRRKLIDVELSKLFPEYIDALYSYNKLLKERNIYLKQTVVDKEYISSIDQMIVQNSLTILKHRFQFVNYLNKHLPKLYLKLVNEPTWIIKITLETVTNEENCDKEHLLRLYHESLSKDILLKGTQVGVHKDDLIVKINDIEITQMASQGQKRMMIIAIKLCLMHYIKEKLGEFPILLLDDVFSEIDELKRRQFIDFLPKDCQTVVTTTDKSHMHLWDEDRFTLLSLIRGQITRE